MGKIIKVYTGAEFDVYEVARWFAALDTADKSEFLVEAAREIYGWNAHQPEMIKAWEES